MPFSFTATVEIKPTIELRDYKAPNPISLKQDHRTVTDEQVEKAIGVLREQMAQLHPTPEGTALSEGDYAVLNVIGTWTAASWREQQKKAISTRSARMPLFWAST